MDFFDLEEDAETHAAELRLAGVQSTFLRPDWTLQVTPYMIDSQVCARQNAEFTVLHDTIIQLPELLFDGDISAFAHGVGFRSPKHDELLRDIDTNDGILPCRWDVCAKGAQWLAFEANFGGALGGLPNDPLHVVYDRIQHLKKAPEDSWLSPGAAIAKSLKVRAGDLSAARFVVIDDAQHYTDSPLTANSAATLLTTHLGQDVPAIGHTALAQLVSESPDPIVAFELFTLNDIAQATDGSYEPYLALCKSGGLRRGVNLLCDLFMSKANLALLHRAAAEGRLDAQTSAIIRRAIPPTDIVHPENHIALAQLPKDNHVLKSAIGHGGSSVFCGWEVSQAEWGAMLSAATDADGPLGMCVLQARVEGDRRPSMSLRPDGLWMESDEPQVLGVFQIDGQFCGGGVRQSISGSGVVNAAKMATVGVIRLTPPFHNPI